MTRRARLALGLLIALLALLAAGAAGGWLLLERWLHAPGPLAAPATVLLPRGVGLGGIAARLAEAGVVDRPLWLQLAARLAGRDRKLRAGEYAFEPGVSPDAVLAKLERGEVVQHKVTVAEGLTVSEVYAILRDSPMLAGGLPPPPQEGRLLPETYLVTRDEARAAVVERMRTALDEALARAWAGRLDGLPLASAEEALTLASIIEKETALADEYPLVAAVLVNRLRRGMPLQTDPSVVFALTGGQGPLGRELTRDDLEIDHPYNTYRNPGLPPGPITNPGRAAIEAAVRPAEVDFLYFVADGSGGHAFARTLEEHNRNVARWRKLRDGG